MLTRKTFEKQGEDVVATYRLQRTADSQKLAGTYMENHADGTSIDFRVEMYVHLGWVFGCGKCASDSPTKRCFFFV